MTNSLSARSQIFAGLCMITALCFCSAGAAAQTKNVPASKPSSAPVTAYRIAGTVVSKTDGHLLGQARISVRNVKGGPPTWMITADDGRFEFAGLAAGKYSLIGAKRGFVQAAYDQHDQFSTAIVTGAGLDTEALVLRLAPTALIYGKVLDEAGDPVRHAMVTAYFDDHSAGVDQIRPYRSAQTDDQGEYEITPIQPGTYFLSVTAKPWYAVHPRANPDPRGRVPGVPVKPPDATGIDRALDVTYPVTYYADVAETDNATPIPIRGGERVPVDFHLNPVPSLRLLFRVPTSPNNGFLMPQLEQSTFDGSTYVQSDGAHPVSPGLVEITGVPAGRYNVHIFGQGDQSEIQMNGVDVAKDGEEIDTSKGEALSTVKVVAQIQGETALPARLAVGLRSGRRPATWQQFDAKGEAELQRIPAGQYEILFSNGPKPYSIVQVSKDGATVADHTLTVTAGSSSTVALTLTGSASDIEGTAKRAGKPFASAMVVLVPKNPESDRSLFRRDQSDLDGTFALKNVVPGSYTILAIADGWDLDWSQPGVIAAYLKAGQPVEVGNQAESTMKLKEAVEVQSK